MTLPKNLDIRRIDVLCGLATEREGMTPSWPVGRTEGETEVPLICKLTTVKETKQCTGFPDQTNPATLTRSAK